MGLRNIYYKLPVSWKFLARKLYYLPIDILDNFRRKDDFSIPKKGDIYIGTGDFIEEGKHQIELLKKYTNLQPESLILDVGCGIGRTALPLTKIVNKNGRYDGFDVVKKGIDWCNKNITENHKNFHFKYVPIHNDLYNNNHEKANQFIFPYSDSSFEIVFLFSVFTHMQVDEISHYLVEISRVMKKGGRCLATFFLYDNDQNYIMHQRNFNFPYERTGYRLMNEEVLSANVALHVDTLKDMTSKTNLSILAYYQGYWKENVDKSSENSFQDIIIFEKL